MVNDGSAAGSLPHLDAFVAEARTLRDEDRLALAEARRRLDEVVRAAAWKAANEVLAGRAEEYISIWMRIGPAHIPDRLEELRGRGSPEEIAELERWQEVARLVRLAMDEALVALLTADTLPPPDIRELIHPWKEMQTAAFEGPAGR
jgi:hypothetical protein